MHGITGKLSGKMGSAVFRVREGQQVVTQYNPIVKNPNTTGQQSQRAKFKLMSQLAAVMSSGIGTLAVTKRKNKGKPSMRNAFTQINFPLVTVDGEAEEMIAKIPMEEVKLTSSFRNLPPMELSDQGGAFDIVINDVASDVTTVRIVVVGYPNNVPSIVKIVDVPVNAESNKLEHEITGLNAGNYTALAYGLIPSESAKTTIDLDNIHTSNDEKFVSAVQLNAMVADGLMAETKTVGANVAVTSA